MATDPSLAPEVAAAPPEPAAAEPAPQPTAQAGSFQFPGLDGLTLPIPIPNPNRPDPAPPAAGTLAPAPPGTWDAGGHMKRRFLEQEAETIHNALVAALDPHPRAQVEHIPFRVLDQADEPNAAAICAHGAPQMVITSAMLTLAAGIAEAKAYDEAAGTETLDRYVTDVVRRVRAEEPVPGVDASLHAAPHATDPNKLARQRHLFDEQVAFILGHELAHHYRGHTDCVSGRTDQEIQRDELARMLAHTVPPFSQPREVEADMWGVVDVLEAGHERRGGTWTEEGALINLDFFRRLSDEGGPDLLLAFLSTHPPAMVRIPIVRATAQQWQPGWRPPVMPMLEASEDGNGVDVTTPLGRIRLPGNLPAGLPFPLPEPRSSMQDRGPSPGERKGSEFRSAERRKCPSIFDERPDRKRARSAGGATGAAQNQAPT